MMDLYCRATDVDAVTLFAEQFRLRPGERPHPGAGLHLRYRDGVLMLGRGDEPRAVYVSDLDVRRRVTGDFALGRACGIRRGTSLDILDATGGLGLDGMALAVRGQRVLLAERVPALWAMLTNLSERMAPIDARVRLADCRLLLGEDHVFDVIYFDPMFPLRSKSALPGKRMQYVGALVEGESDFEVGLIDRARSRARSRVVLKRRLKDPSSGGTPDWQVRGRTVRYDVYAGRGAEPPRFVGTGSQPSRSTA